MCLWIKSLFTDTIKPSPATNSSTQIHVLESNIQHTQLEWHKIYTDLLDSNCMCVICSTFTLSDKVSSIFYTLQTLFSFQTTHFSNIPVSLKQSLNELHKHKHWTWTYNFHSLQVYWFPSISTEIILLKCIHTFGESVRAYREGTSHAMSHLYWLARMYRHLWE